MMRACEERVSECRSEAVARGQAAGRWFMTPHSIRQFIRRAPGAQNLTYEQALGWLIEESTRAHFVKKLPTPGLERWRGKKPWQLRFTVDTRVEPGQKCVLVTVNRGCDFGRRD